MKILLFISLISISLVTHANTENSASNRQVLLANNYHSVTYPMYIPTHEPIKKQIIVDNILIENQITKTIIECDSNGFIEKLLFNDSSQDIYINYVNKIIHYEKMDATMELDNYNNIVKVKDFNNQTLTTLFYNELGQLIATEGIDPPIKEKFTQQFEYDKDKTVNYALMMKNSNILFKFYYDKQEKLTESIISYSIITDFESEKYNISKSQLTTRFSYMDRNHLLPLDIKCIYTEHNQYGDWTKSSCTRGNGTKVSTSTRQLEY